MKIHVTGLHNITLVTQSNYSEKTMPQAIKKEQHLATYNISAHKLVFTNIKVLETESKFINTQNKNLTNTKPS